MAPRHPKFTPKLRPGETIAQRNEAIRYLFQQGKTNKQIAAVFGLTAPAVGEILSRTGLAQSWRTRPNLVTALIAISQARSISAAATTLGTSNQTLHRLLREFDAHEAAEAIFAKRDDVVERVRTILARFYFEREMGIGDAAATIEAIDATLAEVTGRGRENPNAELGRVQFNRG